MKVLVVDDDPYLRVLVSLELPQVDLLEADSVEEGYRTATEARPDCLIVDRKLPDGDGLELVRRLRRTTTTSRTPIIVLTAGHDETHRQEATRAGADDYLAKPFNPEDLLDRLEEALAIPGPERRARRQENVGRLEQDRSPIDLRHGDPEIDLRDRPEQEERSGRRWFRRRTG